MTTLQTEQGFASLSLENDLYTIDYEYVEVTSLGGPIEYLRGGPGELSRELLVAREKYVAGQISSDAFERTVERLLEERSK